MKILITGPQGSGKTTQAQITAEKLGMPLVDTGEMLRNMIRTDKSEEGREIGEEMQKGELVDDRVVAELVAHRLENDDCRVGFVMDGYPRDMGSLQLFDPQFDKVFYLHVSDSEVEKRLLARGREDDNPEAIGERLKLYHEQTEPVLKFYEGQGKLVRIDGQRSVSEVAEDIQNNLKETVGEQE